jgi:hypothetical protein
MKPVKDTAAAASFIADMTRELAAMARKTHQSNLAYLLDVAALEARRTAESPYPDIQKGSVEPISRH